MNDSTIRKSKEGVAFFLMVSVVRASVISPCSIIARDHRNRSVVKYTLERHASGDEAPDYWTLVVIIVRDRPACKTNAQNYKDEREP